MDVQYLRVIRLAFLFTTYYIHFYTVVYVYETTLQYSMSIANADWRARAASTRACGRTSCA